MANYTYKCYKCECKKDVSHGIFVEVEIKCEICGENMVRIIDSPTYYLNPPHVDLDSL
jgi:predicted nucleic acid-binding Zn ribbon protein